MNRTMHSQISQIDLKNSHMQIWRHLLNVLTFFKVLIDSVHVITIDNQYITDTTAL